MKLFAFIFIVPTFFVKGFRGIKMSADINNVVKNRYLLPKEGYNGLVNKIEHKDVSKIYFSGNLDSIIAENKEETGVIYED